MVTRGRRTSVTTAGDHDAHAHNCKQDARPQHSETLKLVLPRELRIENGGHQVVGEQNLAQDAIGGAVKPTCRGFDMMPSMSMSMLTKAMVAEPGHTHHAGPAPGQRFRESCPAECLARARSDVSSTRRGSTAACITFPTTFPSHQPPKHMFGVAAQQESDQDADRHHCSCRSWPAVDAPCPTPPNPATPRTRSRSPQRRTERTSRAKAPSPMPNTAPEAAAAKQPSNSADAAPAGRFLAQPPDIAQSTVRLRVAARNR